ncbi:MAG: 2-hydroxychromene-2-carboxylate isomerase [Polyangiaceae bacterium]
MASPHTIDFWFDYSCPYAYLGFTQLERVARLTDAKVSLKPMLLGGVFRANGTPQKLFATLSSQKARHNGEELERWARLFDVPLTMPAAHPFRTVEALRATIATGVDPKVVAGFYRAYWAENRAPSDETTMREVLSNAGHDANAILERIKSEDLKADLFRRTEEAIALGIFGAPAYVVDGERLYWGQDRMHMALGLRAEDVYPLLPSTSQSETNAMRTLDFFWDFSSPFAYLGNTQAEALAERTGAKLVSRPMLLGGLFKAIGQVDVPLSTWSDAKRDYTLKDIVRWAEYWNVPFRWPSRFPMSSIKPLRAYLALPEDRRLDFRRKVFAAYWAEDRDIADDAVLADLIGDGAAEVLQKTQDPAIKQELISATKFAEQKGVFGAPTWILDDRDLFWGQDRVLLVERALSKNAVS